MSAQINLLNPALRRRRVVVSLRHLGLVVAVAVLAMALGQAYLAHDLSRARTTLAAIQDAHDARVARLAKLQGAERPGDASALGAEIRRLESELRAQQEGLAALRSGAVGARAGYAEYLRALSRGAVHGLWLTGFTIAGSGDITLHGRLTRAEFLPQYIQRLSGEPVLRGRTFATLDVTQPAAGAPPAALAPPEYLEFTLASSERQAVAAAGGSGRTP